MKCDHNDAGDDEDPCFEPTQPQHIPLQTCSCAQIKDMTRHLVMRFGRMMDTNSETEEIEWLANSAVAGYIGLFPPRLSWNHPKRSQISIVSNRGRTDFGTHGHRVAKKWHCRCAMKSHDGFQGKPTGHIRFGEKNRGFRQHWWWSWPFHIHPNLQSSPNIRGWYRWYP